MGKETSPVVETPPVPIKTYRWEDIRRARKRGGYPWTHLDKPPLGNDAWKYMDDHEYEPIGAPPPKITDDLDLGGDEEFDAIKVGLKSETSSTSSRERRFLRIPLDDELVVLPGDGEDEDEAMAIRSMEGENGEAKAKEPQEPQELELEERCVTATPTTTDRTDYDVHTSQLDSSCLEDVPLKREDRRKDSITEKQSEARGFQQKLRSQAGRIRSKLRSMPKPNIKLPERPKFNMPERPKFHLPERPKFNLPERPKFHLPERPKFNLPERPKFNLPERPKFNLPERPKFHMPERPKFNFPERPKFTMPERPKFNLPQRPKLSMPSFSMSRGKDKSQRTSSSTRRPLRERSQLSSSTASSTKRKIFDFDFKTYPRIFDRKSRRAEYVTSSPKASRGHTPPPQMPTRKKGKWLQRFTDLKYGDEPPPPTSATSEADSRLRDDLDAEEFRDDIDVEVAEGSESTSAFRDKDYGYAVTIEDTQRPPMQAEMERIRASSSSVPESDREARSSGSSSLRRRAGVLEEIDSDEFFLREKGLSQEDVEVGRYLTSEIREAFRAPVSALSQMDNYEYYDDEEDVENLGQQYRSTPERGPTRPARTRTLRTRKRSSKSKSPAEEEDSSQFFNTFPPARPKRSRQLQQQMETAEEEVSKEKEEYDQEMGVDETEEPKMSSKKDIPSFMVTDDDYLHRSAEENEEDIEPISEGQWQAEDYVAESQPPMPPKRIRRSRKEPLPDALCNGDYTKEDWLENLEKVVPSEEVMAMRMDSDYIIPAAPPEDFELTPEPPRRSRRKSSRGTSLADEDRTSRGASSLPSERDHMVDDFHFDLSLPEIPGYASVEKPSTKPRRVKSARPSAPGRRKKANGHQRAYPHFYSLPHRPPPIRPLRNYSTLGPSRPPRKQKELSAEELDRKRSESYIEIEDDMEPSSLGEEIHESSRDLQSGDIIERMKGRPLPPPPRPPRKGRETRDTQDTTEDRAPLYKDEELERENEEEEEELEEPEDAFESTKEEPLGALKDNIFFAHEEVTSYDDGKLDEELAQLEREQRELSPIDLDEKIREPSPLSLEIPVEEATVATQTDPLPDDVCVVTGDEEVPFITTATVGTETSWRVAPSTPKTSNFGQQTIPEPPPTPPPPTVIEKPIPYYVMPDPDTEIELKAQRLQISELDVERLNVGELQAQKILVSDIDGMSLQVAELTSKSGNLVLSGLELPPGFLQDLVDSLPIPPPSAPIPVQIQYIPTPVPSTPEPTPVQLVQHSTEPAPQISQVLVQSTPVSIVSSESATSAASEAPSESTKTPNSPITPTSEVPLVSTAFHEVTTASMSSPGMPSTPIISPDAPPAPTSSPEVSPVPTSSPEAPSAPTSAEAPTEVVESSNVLSSTPEVSVESTTTTVTQPLSSPVSPAVSSVPSSTTNSLPPQNPSNPNVTSVPPQNPSNPNVTSIPPQNPSNPNVTSIPLAPQNIPNPHQIPTIPIQQTIPLHSILNPNLVHSIDGLHSYLPDYIPPQIPVSVRIPSRTRSHIQRELESEEEMISLIHTPSSRRRRHHVSKPVARYSSDEEEEEEYSSYRPPSRHPQSSSRGMEPSIGELGRQLVHACQGVTMRALHQLVQYVAPQVREGEDKRRDLQIALCILLVLVAGLILMGYGSGKTYHTHHWDYQFPPRR